MGAFCLDPFLSQFELLLQEQLSKVQKDVTSARDAEAVPLDRSSCRAATKQWKRDQQM